MATPRPAGRYPNSILCTFSDKTLLRLNLVADQKEMPVRQVIRNAVNAYLAISLGLDHPTADIPVRDPADQQEPQLPFGDTGE